MRSTKYFKSTSFVFCNSKTVQKKNWLRLKVKRSFRIDVVTSTWIWRPSSIYRLYSRCVLPVKYLPVADRWLLVSLVLSLHTPYTIDTFSSA